ncbi:MAG: thiamine phosphate synthase [Dehalococcoidia bacterium]|nr:thiamine phosphate synthase [Dehalococcoidia bacterium]MSQ16732.1 thiamine phosphate synthase [Dehalococcoidia bacterium]
MTSANLRNPWPAAGYPALSSSLEALAQGCPALVENFPASLMRRLGQLAADLQPRASSSQSTAPRDALTLDDALSLTTTARSLLASVSGQPGVAGAGAAAGQALSQALDELAAQLGIALRRQQADRIYGLYVIIDPQVTGGRDPLDIAKAAVRGGARMLQLRDKLRDKGQILPLAIALNQLCRDNDVTLIINDHVDLAASIGSHGVHVGQTDLPVAQARRVLAPHQVLGRSNREIDLLVQSQEMGADHVAFGAIYQTTTKPGGRPPQGVQRLREARKFAKVPLVAIGGINAENVAPVVQAGADAICVTAAVGSAANPEAAARRLVQAIRDAGGRA